MRRRARRRVPLARPRPTNPPAARVPGPEPPGPGSPAGATEEAAGPDVLAARPAPDPLVDAAVRRREAQVDELNPFGMLGRPLHRSPFVVGFTFALGAILAYVVYRAVITVWSVLLLIIVAAFLAIGLQPVVRRLERIGIRRGFAVALVFLAFLGIFAGFGFAVVPPIVNQVKEFANAAPSYLDQLQRNHTFEALNHRFGIISRLQKALSTRTLSATGAAALGGIFGVGKLLFNTVFSIFTVLILTLYFVSAFERIKQGAYHLVPRSRRARTVLLGDEILTRVGGYLSGAFIIALIAGASSLVWMSLPFTGVPYALALALLVAILDLIPLVGATIGAVLVTLIAFTVSIPVGIATGIFYVVYQQIENYLIYPRVMKRSVDISPAAAIVAVLIGAGLLGVLGALVAIPVTAAISLIAREIILPRQDSG